MTADGHVATAELSNDSACTGYLVPADVVRAWQRNQKLLEIGRPADKNIGDKLAELEQVVKRKDDDDVIPPSDKQMIVARKLGNFLTSKKTRGIDNAVVSREGLPTSAGQTDTTQMSEERMLANILVTYIRKARKIMQAWAEKGMTWDKDGKVYLDGRPVLGANMSSLLRHAATRRARGPVPEGYESVFQHMESQQLPRSMHVNPVWRKTHGISGRDPFESGSEHDDIRGAEGYTTPPSLVPTKYDSRAASSFIPSEEWESISDDNDGDADDDDDNVIITGVKKRKRKKLDDSLTITHHPPFTPGNR